MSIVTSPPPQSVRQLRIWANGRLYDDASDARVDATDHGLVVGDGVFEALKVTRHGAFAVQRHLDRLSRSAAAMGLPAPDHAEVRAAIDAVISERTYELGKIRITYTGGPGPLGSQAAFGPPTLVVATEAMPGPETSTTIVTAPWTRNEYGALAGVKSTSYGENVRALAYAFERGASEAILVNTSGNVSEGTGSNIFFVFGDTVITPPLTAGPLRGVTRDVLLEWTSITERDLTLAEAKAADEIFITSSLRDVQQVDRWDETTYPSARPVTAKVAETFAQKATQMIDP